MNNSKRGLNRKIRKLKNNPRLFFLDFFKKHTFKLKNRLYLSLPKISRNTKKFTIISAVYNVEEYLDDYFHSLVNQRLDFETNIEVILVDDGSPDNSKDIILKWMNKYPHNIFYIRKENGGQASARNLGIKNIKTEWVTFIDPDDFLDVNYFYLINSNIENISNAGAVITKFKLFKEKFGTYHDGFQTDYCFSKPIRILESSDMEDCVQFSSSSSVYKTDIIRKNEIRFDERLTASFEDTKFFYEYLFNLNKQYPSKIIYIKDAIYNYRLRENESSSTNGQWSKKAKYQEFFDYGLKSVIEKFKNENGKIPVYVQRLILFSVIPYLQVASINKNRILTVLDTHEANQLISTIKECLDYVDKDILESFYNSPGNYFWISAISHYFKNCFPEDKRVYVNKVDLDTNLVYLRFYGSKELTTFQMRLDNNIHYPQSVKTVQHKIFDNILIDEFNVCFKIPLGATVDFSIDGELSKIYTDFKILNPADTDFYDGYIKKKENLKNIAVFVDSGHKADDNAEHLYHSWCIQNKLKLPFDCFYLLEKNSPHWNRLFRKGFQLVDINSLKAINLIKNASYIFSSYLPGHLNQWVKGHNFKFQNFIFLQHGIVTSNLSKPFNASYSQVHKMVLTTNFEKTEFLDEKYNYIFHESDLIYSGLPRLDNLTELARKNSAKKSRSKIKKILVCPTWRSKFNTLNLELKKHLDEFMVSSYLENWIGFLNSNIIQKELDKNSIEVTFCPHINFYSLLEEYNLVENIMGTIDKRIRILNPSKVSYQDLFVENDILITDYSSLHFDFAFLEKSVIYFQFDKNEFYGVTHAYQKGIFDFEKDGFGPVIQSKNDLQIVLKNYLSRGERLFKKYKERKNNIFLHLDDDSSSIIYKEITKNIH